MRFALPEFSHQHRHGADIGPIVVARTRSVSLVIWPAMAGAFFVAPWAVPAVLGLDWTSAVPVTQALCLVGALQVSQGFVRPAMLTVGAVRTYFLFTVGVMLGSAAVYLAVASNGALAVALGYAVVAVVVAPALALVGATALQVRASRMIGAIVSGFPAAIAVGLPVLLAGAFAGESGQRQAVQALTAIVLVAATLTVVHRLGLVVPRRSALAVQDDGARASGVDEPRFQS